MTPAGMSHWVNCVVLAVGRCAIAANTSATKASAAETSAAGTGDGEVVLRLVVEDLQVLRAPSRGRAAVDVVDEISFHVQPGQVLGLVGESGSGKTTMALALLGYVRRGLVFDTRPDPNIRQHELAADCRGGIDAQGGCVEVAPIGPMLNGDFWSLCEQEPIEARRDGH